MCWVVFVNAGDTAQQVLSFSQRIKKIGKKGKTREMIEPRSDKSGCSFWVSSGFYHGEKYHDQKQLGYTPLLRKSG